MSSHREKIVYSDQKLFKSIGEKGWYWGVTASNKYKMEYLCAADPWIPGEETEKVQTKKAPRYFIPKDKFPKELSEQYNISFAGDYGELPPKTDTTTTAPVVKTQYQPQPEPQIKAKPQPLPTPTTISFPETIKIKNESLESIDNTLKLMLEKLESLSKYADDILETKNAFICACTQLSLLRNAILERNDLSHSSEEEHIAKMEEEIQSNNKKRKTEH